MESTKVVRFRYGAENLGNGLLMQVEMWKKMSKVGSFANVIGDGDQPLYPSCSKYIKLSALVKLYNLKAKHVMSDGCFTKLLILQGDLLP
ncbi:unnamed protein product [Prunus brigantina]